MRKVSDEQAALIRLLLRLGARPSRVAAWFNISRQTVNDIKQGNTHGDEPNNSEHLARSGGAHTADSTGGGSDGRGDRGEAAGQETGQEGDHTMRRKASQTDTQADKLLSELSDGKHELEDAMAENRRAQQELLKALDRLVREAQA